MAVKRTRSGYQLWWYDADGRFRKRTIRGISRDEAVRIEREILAARDRGERPIDERDAPLFDVFAKQWLEESRAAWKASTLSQYQQILKSQLSPAFRELRVSAITESRVRALLTRLVWYPTLGKATLSRRTMYQTRHTFASNALAAGEAPSWVAAMLGHASPEMLFSVYARFIPNRTRRDGSALVNRMDGAGERAAERKEG
jgi:integrase